MLPPLSWRRGRPLYTPWPVCCGRGRPCGRNALPRHRAPPWLAANQLPRVSSRCCGPPPCVGAPPALHTSAPLRAVAAAPPALRAGASPGDRREPPPPARRCSAWDTIFFPFFLKKFATLCKMLTKPTFLKITFMKMWE
jgi:hypothetical protein